MAAVSAAIVAASLGSVATRRTAANQVWISTGGHSQCSVRDSRTFRCRAPIFSSSVGKDVVSVPPPIEGRMETAVMKDEIRQLDLSAAHAVLRKFVRQVGDNATAPSVDPTELLGRKVGFVLNYDRDDPFDRRELSEMPDIRPWFVHLDATYPWLPVVLDWRAGEIAQNAAILVPHQVQQLLQRIVGRIPISKLRASSSNTDSESQDSHGIRADAGQCGRREIGMAAVAFCLFTFLNSKSDDAQAAGLDKYLKKKKLDPLDTYVPSVLLAQSQFQEVDGKLEGGEQKTYADARSLLRTGPAASLRTDIRAVAQYAAETGNEDGTAAVDQCLSALEDLDSLLLQASRSSGAPVERMKKDLTLTVSALDRLLATVPTEILEKSKAIAEAYKESSY